MIVWSEAQTCIWPGWCHCHWLSLASVKSRLVLPFWYRLTRVFPEKCAVKHVYVYYKLYDHTFQVKCLLIWWLELRDIAFRLPADKHSIWQEAVSYVWVCCNLWTYLFDLPLALSNSTLSTVTGWLWLCECAACQVRPLQEDVARVWESRPGAEEITRWTNSAGQGWRHHWEWSCQQVRGHWISYDQGLPQRKSVKLQKWSPWQVGYVRVYVLTVGAVLVLVQVG